MKLLGLEIRRARAVEKQLQAPPDNRGWFRILESFSGAFQTNTEVELNSVVTHPTVFACVSLIASDIGKMRVRLVEQDKNLIWSETESPSFSPILRKPNHFQIRIKFFEQWIFSKLIWGNTYVLKQRDRRRVVERLYILDPTRVTPLVSPSGEVFYELRRSSNGYDLSGQQDSVVVPAEEIIHDVGVAFFHPLIGLSPIAACGIAAMQGLHIIENSTKFFENGSMPGGILTVPGNISQEQADTLKSSWNTNYSGDNFGAVAVLANGLKYESIAVNAHDSQLIEQLKWTSEIICSVFHVPAYMVGVGDPPNYDNIEALNQQYYTQCLQNLIECIELCLDEGLGLAPDKVENRRLGTEFDLDDLLRMDTAAMISAEKEAVSAGIRAPNEARQRLNLKPVKGGDTPYLQQQNYSLSALDERDRNSPAPSSSNNSATAPTPEPTPEPEPEDTTAERFAHALWTKLYAA
jgi:HK97 family phage portal protein